ncbi:MAG: PAS domain S-box protein [Candidatus Thiodiazotropha sp.]
MAHLAPDGRWVRANQKFCEWLGYTQDELLDLRIQDLTQADDIDTLHPCIRQVLEGAVESCSCETPCRRKHGDRVWVHLSLSLLMTSDLEPDCILVIVQDVQPDQSLQIQRSDGEETSTTRAGARINPARAGQELTQAASEDSQRYQAVLSTTKDGFWLVNSDARLVDVNQAYCAYTGYQRDELLGKGVWELDVDEDPQSVFRRLVDFKRVGNAIFEATHRCKDGTTWDVEVSVSYSPIQNGQFFVFLRDIYERKAIEDALRNESRKLRDANHLAGLAHWEMDLESGSVYWSPEMYDILQCDPSQDPTKVPEADRHFDAESGARLSAAIQHCIESGESYELDLRVLLTEDRIRWVTARGRAVYGEDQNIIGIRGTVQDITRRKQDEDDIRRFATIFRNAAWGMVIVDADTECITHVNPAFARMHGFAIDALIGRPVLQMYAPEARHQVPDFVSQAHRDGHLLVETRHVRQDGSTFPCRLDITVYTDKAGRPLFRAANVEDISESLRTQVALREAAERYASVIQTTLDGYWVIDTEGCLREVNDAYCRMSGYTREELLGMLVEDLDAIQSGPEVQRNLRRVMAEGSIIFESLHRRKNGENWDVEIVVSYAAIQGGQFFCFFRDITIRKREQALVALRQLLTDHLMDYSRETLMRCALDDAESASSSLLGYFQIVESGQQTAGLREWSSRTLRDIRFLEGSALQRLQADVVAECLATQEAVICNEPLSPAGRFKRNLESLGAIRLLCVPVIRDAEVRAVMSVAGKSIPYAQHDLDLVREIANLAYDFHERKRAEEQIQFMAYYDVLTRLPNRALLSDRLQQAMAQAHRTGQLVGVCYFDLDGFTPVNEHYGHEVGDKLLVKLAENLLQSLHEGDSLARMGGDEFAVVLTGLKSAYECETLVEGMLAAIQVPINVESHRVHLSASIGVTLYPTDDVDAETLLRHADQAMYEAKATGKSKFRIYDPIRDQNVLEMRHLLADFDAALHSGQLVLHYQPKIDLRDGTVTGVEALIRWNHPRRGLLFPADFLPAIEDTPQELALGEWVARNALDQHVEWSAQGMPLSISINISPRQMQMLEFAEFLASLLKHYPPGTAERLEIEMLEIAAIGNIDKAIAVMNACAELGIRFSLDDFGTGYSSLTYFHRLPIDIVKIDQHFVREILTDTRDLDIVEGVLRLADVLKRPVVAEGVESIEIGMILLSLGCNYAQGFGIARPMEAEHIRRWLKQWQSANTWRDLLSEFSSDPENYHTNVAIISHKLWLEDISQYVRDKNAANLPPLDDHECQFAQWYAGIGRTRYADNPSYVHIAHAHRAIHESARQVVNHVDSGEREKAENELRELYLLAENMNHLLRSMAG